MTLIFKKFNIKAVIEKVRSYDVFNKVVEFLKNNRVLVRVSAVCLVGMLSVGICVVSTGITLGFDVKYSGKKIATVRNQTVVKQAEKIAVTNVSGKAAKKAIKHPELSLTVTVRDKLDNADTVAEAIITNTGEIVEGAALIVNGEKVAYANIEELNLAIEERKNLYFVAGAQNVISFVEAVEVVNGYYLKTDIDTSEKVRECVANLSVKNVATTTYDKVVAFQTKQVNTSLHERGYYKVTTKGQNGLNRTTEVIETVNGVQIQKTVLSDEVISTPVTQVVTVGTAPVFITPTEYANITSAGLICPLSKASLKKITAYWGDGRNHKGIDLAADKGVAIFAAASGTVVSSGWHSSYGYNITIDHGNGMQTRYAHASALCVKSGQYVTQGEMIAAVGSTGYSTGNHLHFEVIINGNRVNPAPYIGLN